MIKAVIYYDGCLKNLNLTSSLAIWANKENKVEVFDAIFIDASYGYKQNENQLKTSLANSKEQENVFEVIVTNSLIAYDNGLLKDTVSASPILNNYYIFDQYGIHSLQDFADKELLVTYNLEKMYINGAFEKL